MPELACYGCDRVHLDGCDFVTRLDEGSNGAARIAQERIAERFVSDQPSNQNFNASL